MAEMSGAPMSLSSEPMDWVAFWDRKAKEGGAASAGRSTGSIAETFSILAHVARVLGLRPEHMLLDVGCGSGVLGEHLMQVCQYVGVDASEEQLLAFRAKHADRVTLSRQDAGALPRHWVAGYDRVLLQSVLQYMHNMEGARRAIIEAYRVLKPGGVALFGMNPDPSKRYRYIADIPGDRPESLRAAQAALWFDPSELLATIARGGFQEVEIVHLPADVWQSWYQFDVVARKG